MIIPRNSECTGRTSIGRDSSLTRSLRVKEDSEEPECEGNPTGIIIPVGSLMKKAVRVCHVGGPSQQCSHGGSTRSNFKL